MMRTHENEDSHHLKAFSAAVEITGEPSMQEDQMYPDYYITTIIQELHNPDHSNSKVKHLFQLVEDCIDRATQSIGERSQDALLAVGDGKQALHGLKDDTELLGIVESISCQITTDILNGIDAHSITIWLLKYLAKYTWENKVVLTLTAFGLTFGDFWLLVRIYSRNAIDEPMTNDQSAAFSGNKEAYINHLEANNDFIKGLVNTTRYIIEIEELTSMYFSKKYDRIPIDVYLYWIIRSAIAAAIQIIILSSRGPHQYVTGIPDTKESDKLKFISDELRRILSDLYKRVGEMEIMKVYKSEKTDNIKLMRSLINPDNDLRPLYHGVTNRKDHLDILRKKHVLLLISGLNISPKDIAILKLVINDSITHDIVWIPVVEHSFPGINDVLETMQKSMPWYFVHQLSMITEAAILFFRTEWDFKGSPILVHLSPQGKVLHKNAMHMVRIWQNLSIDNLTSEVELQLWEKETWDLKLLVNDIDPIIQQWIQDEKYTFLYGSTDIDWTKKFTKQAHSMASALQLKIEMVYVGISHSKNHVRRVKDMIMAEQLSHCLPQSTKDYFWSRIDSMIYSKLKLGKMNDHSDTLLQEILRFHSHEEWVLLARGSRILVHGPGRIALTALEEIRHWRERGVEPGYVNQFLKHYKGVNHCHSLFLPVTEAVPDCIQCPSCQRNMENFNYLMCC